MSRNRYYQEPGPSTAHRQGEGAYPTYDPASYRPDPHYPQPPVYDGYGDYDGYGAYPGHGEAAYSPRPGQGPYPPPYPNQPQARHAPHPYQKPRPHMQTGAQTAAPISLAGVGHALGAVLSVALIVGGLGWAWQMMQRDVAGVPVVRALEGPVRVVPDNPGGRQAAHQGLSVNELAAGQEEAPREQIVLAPAPLDLPAEDMETIQPPEELRPREAADDGNEPIPVALTQELADRPEASALGMRNPSRRAVANSPRPPARDAATVETARASARPAPSEGTLSDDELAAALASNVAAGLSSVRDIDVDPATIGPGTRLVQLGAYDDVETARAAWDQLARRFAPLLDDRGRVIEAAHSGGSVFYRLRAHGFSDERDARRFCAALVDQQIDCIPVLVR